MVDLRGGRHAGNEGNPNFPERNPSRVEQIPNSAEQIPNSNLNFLSPDRAFSLPYADPLPVF
jgi:hypothetical protein